MSRALAIEESLVLPPSLPDADIPILYEDEDEGDMGEANLHVKSDEILHVCLSAHLAVYHADLQCFRNMNLYYRDEPLHKVTGSKPYISPDCFAVKPFNPLPEDLVSYTIGVQGPAPLMTAEVLSRRSAQQRDLGDKAIVCAKLGVAEYILVDETGKYLPERLLLKRLQPDGTYIDEHAADGGITSVLGFRLVFEADGLRVIDVKTGYRYIRPREAEAQAKLRLLAEEAQRRAEADRQRAENELRKEAEARRSAEDKLRALEQELERLKKQAPPNQG